ncbi:hypothetical protein Acr_24g0013400 [Actinidia rufa]|uniref:Uncharacterized protein n=1 Tax=Actinidia rufa TaxID=165716 RepID=A0A7J0GWC6_9ERIC|nr:hypothetical protein Acr_24g0013400 [Actinidia rufa]
MADHPPRQQPSHQRSHQVVKAATAVTAGGSLLVLSGLNPRQYGDRSDHSHAFAGDIQYVTGKHPPGADQLDQARQKLASKAREMRDKAEQFGQQHIRGSQAS